jgi:hypothetical protein
MIILSSKLEVFVRLETAVTSTPVRRLVTVRVELATDIEAVPGNYKVRTWSVLANQIPYFPCDNEGSVNTSSAPLEKARSKKGARPSLPATFSPLLTVKHSMPYVAAGPR